MVVLTVVGLLLVARTDTRCGDVMTATSGPARGPVVPPATWGVALLLPLGPAAIAVLRLILPYYTAERHSRHGRRRRRGPGTAERSPLARVHRHPHPGARPFRSRPALSDAAPRLTSWALGLPSRAISRSACWWAPTTCCGALGRRPVGADAVAVVDAGHPTIGIAIGVFVLGHVVGTVLLGLALLRSGRIPAWAGWAIAVSQPLHFVATVILGSPQVDFVAWSLTAVGMAFVARDVLSDR